MTQEETAIEQSDRDGAADYWKGLVNERELKAMRAGERDDHWKIRELAIRRAAASTRPCMPRDPPHSTQEETAAWMGVDVATMNLAHDCLHHALCDAFKVSSRAMRQAAGETLDPAEQHLADLEENAVLHVQRWLHAAGVL